MLLIYKHITQHSAQHAQRMYIVTYVYSPMRLRMQLHTSAEYGTNFREATFPRQNVSQIHSCLIDICRPRQSTSITSRPDKCIYVYVTYE